VFVALQVEQLAVQLGLQHTDLRIAALFVEWNQFVFDQQVHEHVLVQLLAIGNLGVLDGLQVSLLLVPQAHHVLERVFVDCFGESHVGILHLFV